METRMPSGELLREAFKDEKSMNKRRNQLEQMGGKVERVFHVHENRSKYQPHQGAKEMERRRK